MFSDLNMTETVNNRQTGRPALLSLTKLLGYNRLVGGGRTLKNRPISVHPSCQREPEQVAPPGSRRQLVALANLRCDDSALPGARKTGSAGGVGWDSHQSPGFYSSLRIHHKDRFLESLHPSWK